MAGWFAECQRWAKELEALLPEKIVELPAEGDTFVVATKATYFIMSARCVYLHCESLLEAKLRDKNKAKEWLAKHYGNCSPIKRLLNLGDWLNHGAIYRSPDFKPFFLMLQGLDKTFEEALDEVNKSKKSVTIGVEVRPCWTDGDGTTSGDVRQWQQKVLSELQAMIQDIKQVS
ncbi:MAG: hypothetical protein WAN11_19320 [Syntrophobacteraceae bacterium]